MLRNINQTFSQFISKTSSIWMKRENWLILILSCRILKLIQAAKLLPRWHPLRQLRHLLTFTKTHKLWKKLIPPLDPLQRIEVPIINSSQPSMESSRVWDPRRSWKISRTILVSGEETSCQRGRSQRDPVGHLLVKGTINLSGRICITKEEFAGTKNDSDFIIY